MVIPKGVEIKVSGNPSGLAKDRRSAVFGPILTSAKYQIHNNNIENIKLGLLERVFRVKNSDGELVPPVIPDEKEFTTTLAPEKRYLCAHPKLKPISSDSVLNLWHGSKLAVYTRAYNSLLVRPLSRRDSVLSTFVKVEKNLVNPRKIAVPRVIQPRNPRYNFELAKYLKPNEKEFYRRIDRMWDKDGTGDKTIFKGLNAVQTAHHMLLKSKRYHNPVFIGLDASRFDQHVSHVALEWEHSIYKNCFSYGIQKLSELLSWQVQNIGRAYCQGQLIKYKVLGRRMSGDMNTSLGNCILMSSMVHAYMREKGIPSSLANNGDDCVLMFEKKFLPRISDLSDWFLRLGFKMVIEDPLFDLREVPFCQTNVLTSPDYNISVRSPTVALSKDLHSTYNFNHASQYDQWLSSVGICGKMSTQGVPVLQAFYNAFPDERVTNKDFIIEMEREIEYCMVGGSVKRDISDEMRVSFWRAFGILPDAQIELETMFKHIKFSGEHYTHINDVHATPYASLLQSILKI